MGAPMLAQLAKRFPGDVSLVDIDAKLATRVASQTGAKTAGEMADDKTKYPAYSAILESFEQGVDAGWGDEDFSAVMHLVEKRLGKSIKR